jgi:hypothetical protein
MVQTQIPRDRAQPPGRCVARADLLKALKRFQEHRLRHILRFGRVAEEPHRGAEHHVLVGANERLERGVRHPSPRHGRSPGRNTAGAEKLQGFTAAVMSR